MIQMWLDHPCSNQTEKFTAEYEPVRPVDEVQRLLPHPIPNQHKSLPARIEDREREHTSQVMNTCIAMFLVEMNDGLTVASSPEYVAPALQGLPKFHRVVDLAVGNDDHSSIFAEQRLPSGLWIHDGQACHADSDTLLDMKAFAIRPAMPGGVCEPPEVPAIFG
jgi:hypothetical protein